MISDYEKRTVCWEFNLEITGVQFFRHTMEHESPFIIGFIVMVYLTLFTVAW